MLSQKRKLNITACGIILFVLLCHVLSHIMFLVGKGLEYTTASLHKLAAGRKLAATHLNVSNRRMCVCTGFKSGSYNKSYYNRPLKNDTGL